MNRRFLTVTAVLLVLLMVSVGSLFATGQGEQEGGEVVLEFPTFWVGQDAKAEIVASLVEEFNAEYEGQYQVDIQANPDTDGYRDKINSSIAAGQVPDIFVFNPDPTTFQYYEGDLLFDFTEELEGSWGDNFVSGTIEGATRNGVVKSVPFEVGVTPIWYNEDLLAEAGWDSFPETIEDFWQMADDLTEIGVAPTSQMTGGSNAWTSMLWYSHILASIGGPDVWNRPLSHPQYVQAAEIMQRMFQEYTTDDAVGAGPGESSGHYMSERTAIFINGPWFIGNITEQAPEVKEATRLTPAPQVGDYHGHQISFPLSNLAAGNTDDPRKREAVLAFMKFMTDPENVRRISLDAGSMFAIKYSLSEDEVDPLQSRFIEAFSNAEFTVTHMQANYPVDLIAELGQGFGAMALGRQTPEEFVENLQQLNN
ncbi:MAG: extracellular solute-binding protein [Spirochaetes bacterium]|nr:extracellular solute-binding protein [Spirochaetota bacterium]